MTAVNAFGYVVDYCESSPSIGQSLVFFQISFHDSLRCDKVYMLYIVRFWHYGLKNLRGDPEVNSELNDSFRGSTFDFSYINIQRSEYECSQPFQERLIRISSV